LQFNHFKFTNVDKIFLTLEIPWESIRLFEKRYIQTLEGPKIDVLSLKKATLNSSKINIDGNKVTFEKDLLKDGLSINSAVIFFQGVNNLGADGFVEKVRSNDEEIDVYIYDSNPNTEFKGQIRNGKVKIPTFGMGFEELFSILEQSNVISRVSVYSFLITNKESFYSLIGEKRLNFEDVIQSLKNFGK
jgi:hypothetical protein